MTLAPVPTVTLQVCPSLVPVLFGRSCPGALGFLLREANLSQAGWFALVAITFSIPLKHAVWAYGGVVAALLSRLQQDRAVSLALCPASGERYQAAAGMLATAAACLLPGPLGTEAMELAGRLRPAGAFYAIRGAALLASYALVLVLLIRSELPLRRAFARQHRLAAEASALLRCQDRWQLGKPLIALLGTAAWLACCIAMTLLGL